jgi:hypothetical protein
MSDVLDTLNQTCVSRITVFTSITFFGIARRSINAGFALIFVEKHNATLKLARRTGISDLNLVFV